MATLMIDDCKALELYKQPENGDAVARSFETGIKYLRQSKWDLLLLDHDLGCLGNKGDCPPPDKPCGKWQPDCESKTGYDVMLWLKENPEYLPKAIRCISWNPVGKARIEAMICDLIKEAKCQENATKK